MELKRDNRTVIFRGEVVAKEEFTLYCDELYVYYDENQEIHEIVARGNVKIIKDMRTAVARKAVYDRVNKIVVLTGNARVTRCNDTITGDRITFYMDRDDAFVEGKDGGRVKAIIMPENECEEKDSTGSGR